MHLRDSRIWTKDREEILRQRENRVIEREIKIDKRKAEEEKNKSILLWFGK